MGRDGAVRPAQMVLRTPLVDEIALWVIEQRPILNTTVSLSLDLGVEFLMDLGFGEFAARINERRDSGIAPQLHCEG